MCSRPGREETEDELLQFQEAFLANKTKPSVTLVRGPRESQAVGEKRPCDRDVVSLEGLPTEIPNSTGTTSSNPPKKKSKFKERAARRLKSKQEEVDPNELLDCHDTHITTILSQIKERDSMKCPVMLPMVSEKGFPKVLHRDVTDQAMVNPSGKMLKQQKSLFAQQFMKSSATSFGIPDFKVKLPNLAGGGKSCEEIMDVDVEYTHSTNGMKPVGHDGSPAFPMLPSHVISGVGLAGVAGGPSHLALDEVKRIHEENIERLSALSEEEILEEQSKIKASLDPSIIAFLQKKQNKKCEDQGTVTNTASESKKFSGDEHSNIENELKTENLDKQGAVKREENETVIIQENDIETEKTEKHVHFSENISIAEGSNSEQGEQLIEEISNIDEVKELATKWVHMDKIEVEKLEWMKDCPTPTAMEMKGGQQARFDFEGMLVSRSTDLPTHLGLHHHSDDPGAAGYTLEELLLLARSKFLQQRMFALQVLTRIIQQERQGNFQSLLQDDLLPTLLKAGIVLLLRWALDDSTEAVVSVVVQAFAALLVCPSHEDLITAISSWYRGNEWPSLTPKGEEKKRDKGDDEEESRPPSDVELVKQDVIKGLLQMKLLPRLRYILEVFRPSSPSVRSILRILVRIARHSLHAAVEIARCPRLIETILCEFLPITWKQVESVEQADNVFGLPLVEAMKMMTALCCAGRHLAATLVSKHDLIERILCYTSLHPSDMRLGTEDEAMALCTESLNTWRVCIGYGLACAHFREVHTTVMQQLQSCLSEPVRDSSKADDTHTTVALLGVLEVAIHVAGTTCEIQTKLSTAEHHGVGMDKVPVPPLNWSHVNGFLPLIGLGVQKWTNEFINSNDEITQGRCSFLLSSAFGVMAAFYSKLQVQPSYAPVETLEEIENLMATVVGPLIQSAILQGLLGNLSSTFTYGKPGQEIPALPDYGCPLVSKNETSWWLKLGVSLPLLVSFLRLSCEVASIHKGVISQFAPLVTNVSLVACLKRSINLQKLQPLGLSRMEHHFQYFLIKLFSYLLQTDLRGSLADYVPVYHSAALALFPRLWPGDEYYAYELISNVLFNPQFYCEIAGGESMAITQDLAGLSIKTEATPTPQDNVTSETSHVSREELLCGAFKGLPHARSSFLRVFLDNHKEALKTSRRLSLPEPHLTESLLLPSCQSGPLLPGDWMFLPILELHNEFVDAEMKGRSAADTVTTAEKSSVTATLQLIVLLEEFRPFSLQQVSVVSRIARLLCVFLTGSDMFLEKGIRSCFKGLLDIYTKPGNRAQTDFSAPVPGLSSFYDLFSSFLSHYKAVSFGDPLFACYVLLPLQQRYDSRFKRAVWDEHVEVLRVMSLPIQKLPIPLECFLYPVEQNDSLLSLYLRCLATQTVRPNWSPLFYLIAVHHINAFIFQRVDPQDNAMLTRKLRMLNQVLRVKDEGVRHHLLHYYEPDAGEQSSIKLFNNLPPDRELLLRHRDDSRECRKIYDKMTL